MEELQKKQQALKQQQQPAASSSAVSVASSQMSQTISAGPAQQPTSHSSGIKPLNASSRFPTAPAINNTSTQSSLVEFNYNLASTAGNSAMTNSNQRERVALQHAQQNSFGYFISQDSSFGNLVLPVIPFN